MQNNTNKCLLLILVGVLVTVVYRKLKGNYECILT